uniref:Glutamic acid-rich protein-like n=1 Tax=Bursaphelenchus xylophilus TaxID=6326 RepID=A0A1I7SIR1_BURXY
MEIEPEPSPPIPTEAEAREESNEKEGAPEDDKIEEIIAKAMGIVEANAPEEIVEANEDEDDNILVHNDEDAENVEPTIVDQPKAESAPSESSSSGEESSEALGDSDEEEKEEENKEEGNKEDKKKDEETKETPGLE